MTSERMAYVLMLYEKKLAELLDDGWAANNQIRHAAGMLQQMWLFLGVARDPNLPGSEAMSAWEKLNQWLGFMQGVFFCNQIYSLDEMKDHNRTPVVFAVSDS